MQERTGEAFEFDERLTVIGRKLQPGDNAPEFTLDFFDPNDSVMKSVSLADTKGTVRLLNVINSLDTPVCHAETLNWEKLIPDMASNVRVYTISMDLPFAQARWLTSTNATHEALSSHRDEKFGRDYGVLLKECRLLQRAVFVIDKNDKITYAEYVADQMLEPDYMSAVEALQRASV